MNPHNRMHLPGKSKKLMRLMERAEINQLPRCVAALARCKGIARRTAPTRKTDLFPSN